MRRLLAILAALAALLMMAPAALAAPYAVDDPDDTPDANLADPACDAVGADTCTLRAAIEQANVLPGTDNITFVGDGRNPLVLTPLPELTDTFTMYGAGDTTITFAPAVTGALLDVQTGDSAIRALTVTGGGSGYAINAAGLRTHLDAVVVRNTGGTGIRAGASGVRVDSPLVESTAGTGVLVTGPNVTVSSPTIRNPSGHGIDIGGNGTAVPSPEISDAAGDGIQIRGDGASVTNGRIHGNNGNGVAISGHNDTVSRVTFFANGGRPIAVNSGANGGIPAPENLRVGPRRADGSLPLTGRAAGTIELWAGDPSSVSVPSFLDAFSVNGDFAYNFPSEPAPGSVFAANVSSGGSSEFATVRVPNDITSPEVATARATDTQTVRVDSTEPLDPGSVQKEDFALMMAGAERPITAVSVAPDGRFLTLTSGGWRAGEAGYLQVGAPGAFTDPTGNQSQTAPRLRVAAAPGDFIAPLGAKLSVAPKTICMTRGRRCRRPGMTIRFETTEPGKATIVIKRGNTQVGRRVYGNIVAGANALKFNGRLNARKLRVGRYRFLLYLQDMVGNVTDQPPITLFNVRRTTR